MLSLRLRDRHLPDNPPLEFVAEAVSPGRVRFRALGTLDLHRAGSGELRALLVQPKRLALFAYLVLASPPRLHRRDSLLALFWPESPEEQARRALRQALHFLRKAVGPDVIVSRGDDEVGVDASAVWCDVREFERALDAGRLEDALSLYRGHLLEGFHASGVSAEFEQWLEDGRSQLRDRAVRAALSLAEQAERDANETLATRWLRDVLRFDQGAEPAVRRLMVLLGGAGDRSGALRVYDEFVRHLGGLGAEVSPLPETRALAERLRLGRELVRPLGADTASTSGGTAPSSSRATPADTTDAVRAIGAGRQQHLGAAPVATPPAAPSTPPVRGPQLARWVAGTVGALAVVVAGAAVVRMAAASRDDAAKPTVIAVGAVDDRTGADSLGSARVLRDLLATDLARVPGLTVVSQTRIQELLNRMAVGDETRAALTRAAHSAGASEVLEGELYRRSPSALRLDVRRVDAATGVIRRAYSAEGGDLFALVEWLSGRLAAELGQRPPSPALAELTTTSVVARRFYEEGVRAYYQGDRRGAARLLQAALDEDSTFAMAAYFAARAGAVQRLSNAAQAVRMSHRATERERLLIATYWAEATHNPSVVALAESLARRFPLEPEADIALGRALRWSGDFAGAIRNFRRAADRDSLALGDVAPRTGGKQPPCTACEALDGLVNTYMAADSLAAAERTVREWIRRQPRSIDAWAHLVLVLSRQRRADEALEASRTMQPLFSEVLPDDGFARAQIALQVGNFAEADRLMAERVRDGSAAVREEALWWQVIGLRNQGKLNAALRTARRIREVARDAQATHHLPAAQVLFEMGRAREAAAHFDSATAMILNHLPRGAPDSGLGMRARSLVWHLTHEATASAAAGDTTPLARVADSLQILGRLSAYGRDQRLHHHVRGLLLVARGQREEAAASFRRAIYSPTMGYTRTNLELGRVLMALGRPHEAVAVLAPALRGDLQASNYYVTHAELHEALAQAHESAGQRDSARTHFAWVAKAWQSADPPFRARAARARAAASPH